MADSRDQGRLNPSGRDRGAAAAHALFLEAGRQHRAGRMDEAERLCRETLALDSGHAAALHLLGVIAYQRGRHADAAALIARAIERRGDDPNYHNNFGLVLRAQGKLGEAAASFEHALALRSDFAQAHNNLGVVLLAQKRLAEAGAHFEAALTHRPDDVAAMVNLGTALSEQGMLDAAITQFDRALAINPRSADAQYNRGVALMWQGRVDAAFAAYRIQAELRLAAAAGAPAAAPPAHKLQHDREQLDYLRDAHPESEAFRKVDGQGSFERLLHFEGGARCAAAINPALDAAAIEGRWEESRPKLVVVDDLLAPEALDELRRFCWGSTIWRKPYSNGYLGAFFEDGFACPLLAQIASELSARLPGIIRRRPLRQAWGFKYDSQLDGIVVHADEAAVNVNFWITADDANLDPEAGGLVIWDVPAPLDWPFAKYQNNDSRSIRAFLRERAAAAIRVPYRSNRAVIFDSDLFHETDRFRFRDGYLNRRINITMLYGSRHDEGGV